jgi:hypothetical protein
MPPTLRPTRLSDDPDRKGYSVFDDGIEIGSMYEDTTVSRPELRWFWSITVTGSARTLMKTDGR